MRVLRMTHLEYVEGHEIVLQRLNEIFELKFLS